MPSWDTVIQQYSPAASLQTSAVSFCKGQYALCKRDKDDQSEETSASHQILPSELHHGPRQVGKARHRVLCAQIPHRDTSLPNSSGTRRHPRICRTSESVLTMIWTVKPQGTKAAGYHMCTNAHLWSQRLD